MTPNRTNIITFKSHEFWLRTPLTRYKSIYYVLFAYCLGMGYQYPSSNSIGITPLCKI